MEIVAWYWNWYQGDENDVYTVFINDSVHSYKYIIEKFNINQEELDSIIKRNNAILKRDGKELYIAFYSLTDARNFANWLKSLIIINKLR